MGGGTRLFVPPQAILSFSSVIARGKGFPFTSFMFLISLFSFLYCREGPPLLQGSPLRPVRQYEARRGWRALPETAREQEVLAYAPHHLLWRGYVGSLRQENDQLPPLWFLSHACGPLGL